MEKEYFHTRHYITFQRQYCFLLSEKALVEYLEYLRIQQSLELQEQEMYALLLVMRTLICGTVGCPLGLHTLCEMELIIPENNNSE